ncbi:MAG: acyl-CoA thioesterase [Acidovorax sp.]|nr:acyl-CoA thioesterase [Acidovorax sp.]
MQQATPPHQPPGTHGFTEMVFPERTNHYGTLFGGQALLLMGQAAFVTASRHARQAVVMARCSGVDFLAPVPQGQALELQARVVRCGTSSMTVQVEGAAHDLATGRLVPAVRGAFEMVAVDAAGRPSPLSPTETP